jgi:hypothetical protein
MFGGLLAGFYLGPFWVSSGTFTARFLHPATLGAPQPCHQSWTALPHVPHRLQLPRALTRPCRAARADNFVEPLRLWQRAPEHVTCCAPRPTRALPTPSTAVRCCGCLEAAMARPAVWGTHITTMQNSHRRLWGCCRHRSTIQKLKISVPKKHAAAPWAVPGGLLIQATSCPHVTQVPPGHGRPGIPGMRVARCACRAALKAASSSSIVTASALQHRPLRHVARQRRRFQASVMRRRAAQEAHGVSVYCGCSATRARAYAFQKGLAAGTGKVVRAHKDVKPHNQIPVNAAAACAAP